MAGDLRGADPAEVVEPTPPIATLISGGVGGQLHSPVSASTGFKQLRVDFLVPQRRSG